MRSTLILLAAFAILVLCLFVQTNRLASAHQDIGALDARIAVADSALAACGSESQARRAAWSSALDSLASERDAKRVLAERAATRSERLSARANALAAELLSAPIPAAAPGRAVVSGCDAASAWLIVEADRLTNWYP